MNGACSTHASTGPIAVVLEGFHQVNQAGHDADPVSLGRLQRSDFIEKSNADARTIHFEVEVPAEGEKTVKYTVRYTW